MFFFKASGSVEVAWHLHQWGDTVEVKEPTELRGLVAAQIGDSLRILP